jgi:hypothetical protein
MTVLRPVDALRSQLTATDWLPMVAVSEPHGTLEYVCPIVPGTVNRPERCGPGDASPSGPLDICPIGSFSERLCLDMHMYVD